MVVALDYSAPPECPDRAALIAAVRERSPAARFDGPAPHRYAIAIVRRDDAYAGALDGRELTAGQCSDLVTALALVVSLAIDADAAATTQVAAPLAPSPWRLDGSATGSIGLGVTPDPLVTGELEGRARWRDALALSVAAIAGHDRVSEAAAAASFTLFAARGAACWLPVTGTIEISACGHVELGALHAAGESIAQGRAVTRLWLAPGADARVRWQASSRVFAQLEVGASAPLVRDRYLFEPNMTIHETAPITGWLGLGVGMWFR